MYMYITGMQQLMAQLSSDSSDEDSSVGTASELRLEMHCPGKGRAQYYTCTCMYSCV